MCINFIGYFLVKFYKLVDRSIQFINILIFKIKGGYFDIYVDNNVFDMEGLDFSFICS